MTEPLLEARGLARSLRRRLVLRDVNLAVRRGEIAAVVGENGCGKTTLLRVLVGALAPDAGAVRVAGTLGYCPQEPELFGSLTVREHFRSFAGAYGLDRWETPAGALLQRLRFGAAADVRVDELSGGTRQKLNLALALVHAPDLLVLDEPYAAFDWETYLAFWDIAQELRSHGRGVLLVSHLVHDRTRLDAVYALCEGVLRCD